MPRRLLGLSRARRQLPPVGLREALSAHEKGRAGQLIHHWAGMGGGRPGKNIFGTTCGVRRLIVC